MFLKKHVIHYFTIMLLAVLLTSCGGGGGGDNNLPTNAMRIVVESVDPDGDQVTYRWKATDGSLDTTTGSVVNWTPPNGPGLHFVYVLASDSKGGYDEQRIVINTDDSQNVIQQSSNAMPVVAPKTTTNGGIYRGWISRDADADLPRGLFDPTLRQIYIPDVPIYTLDRDTGVKSETVRTNIFGEFSIPKHEAGIKDLYFSLDNGKTFVAQGENITVNETATTHYRRRRVERDDVEAIQHNIEIFGNVTLIDNALCGTKSYLFNVIETGSAKLLDNDNNNIAGPVRINAFGDYYLTVNVDSLQTGKLVITCDDLISETLISIDPTIPVGDLQPQSIVKNIRLANNKPAIQKITGSSDVIADSQFIKSAPLTILPSDLITSNEVFLSRKGLDTPLSSCMYYKSIAAVADCTANGEMISTITFDQWKQKHLMAPYNVEKEHEATFVNFADLNLTRNHHGVKNSSNHLAFYVCNHLGPNDESQDEIDRVISDAANGRNLIACVAMDYSISPGVNDNQPFIKYHIFGPSGELLPSINLDGRGEKFVPSSCVACHGGDHYAGTYPADGSGVSNLGAHFLPYDIENFKFSSEAGLTEIDQLSEIKSLNLFLLDTNPTDAARNLITHWYINNTLEPDIDYIPDYWVNEGPEGVKLYNFVIKPYCRLCHVAFPEYDFDTRHPLFEQSTCGNEDQLHRNLSMPSSLVTFNRYYDLSNSNGYPPEIISQYEGIDCDLYPTNIWTSTQ